MKRSALWWFFLFASMLAGISLCLLFAPRASASVCDGPEILCPVDTSPAIGGNDGVVVTNDLESPSAILPASSSRTVQPSVCLPFEGCDPMIDTVPALGVSITLVLTGGMVFPTFLQTGTATGTGSTSSPVEGSGIYSIPEIGAIGPLLVAPVVTPLGPGDVPSTLGAQGNGGPPVISSLPPTYRSEGITPPLGVDGPAPWRSWQPVPPVSNILPAGFIPGATSSVTPANLVMPASGSSGVETISTVQGSGNIPGPAGVPVTQGISAAASANSAGVAPLSGTPPSAGPVVSPGPKRHQEGLGGIPSSLSLPGPKEHFPFAEDNLPIPEAANRIYRIVDNEEAATTLRTGQIQPGKRRKTPDKFFSLDSRYPMLHKRKQLKRFIELFKAGKLAESQRALVDWHAAPAQTVVLEIELKPGALEYILRRTVDESNLKYYRKKKEDVYIYKGERGSHNIAIPSWQLAKFNSSFIESIRLYGWRAPFGPVPIPREN